MTNTGYQQLEYRLQFLTPAFIGNAEQSAQWRTPPIKALLRQWWRVVVAAELNYDVREIHKREGELFGVAGDAKNSRKSQVRIRLEHWNAGRLGKQGWEKIGNVKHPEVRFPVGADLYLGYGPLAYNKHSKSAEIKNNAAIQAGENSVLRLACPERYTDELEAAIRLIELYGTVGGRSRNGWGSLELLPISKENTNQSIALNNVSRNWKDALGLDWPHALGRDQKLLVWVTKPCKNWQAVMQQLAQIKIDVRTMFKFNSGRNAGRPEDRHWLSYPVTNHSVSAWGNDFRLPNSLRFKVRKNDKGDLIGVIYHMPCKPPKKFKPDTAVLHAVWQQVHSFLDSDQRLTRLAD